MKAVEKGRATAAGLVSSLRQTLVELLSALSHGDLDKLVSLVKDGSPLELFIDRLLSVVFWVLLVMPLILVPVYYLSLGLLR